MIRNTLFIATLLLGTLAQAQDKEDSVSLGSGYASQSYYHLKNGEVKSTDNSNWDIAFDASGFGYAIRLNSAKGAKLWNYKKGSSNAWSKVDSTGLSGWKPLYDSDTSWTRSAFTLSQNGVDVGWGKYNTTTHQIHGDSLYIIQLVNGDYKKLFLEKLVSGTFYFKYADLDGKNEKNVTLKKSDFKDRNFGYYSMVNHKSINREPDNKSWDLVFTSYSSMVAPGMYYGVTGVLHNMGTKVAKARPVANPKKYTDHKNQSFHHEINSIGYNWKRFDRGAGKYVLADSTCYFIKTVHSNSVYRIVFTDFEGSATGKIKFNIEELEDKTIGMHENSLASSFIIYPNPASSNVNIVLDTDQSISLSIIDMSGSSVYEKELESGFQNHELNVEDFKSGIYFVKLSNSNNTITKKLIIQ